VPWVRHKPGAVASPDPHAPPAARRDCRRELSSGQQLSWLSAAECRPAHTQPPCAGAGVGALGALCRRVRWCDGVGSGCSVPVGNNSWSPPSPSNRGRTRPALRGVRQPKAAACPGQPHSTAERNGVASGPPRRGPCSFRRLARPSTPDGPSPRLPVRLSCCACPALGQAGSIGQLPTLAAPRQRWKTRRCRRRCRGPPGRGRLHLR
jgi:hypothetical protein